MVARHWLGANEGAPVGTGVPLRDQVFPMVGGSARARALRCVVFLSNGTMTNFGSGCLLHVASTSGERFVCVLTAAHVVKSRTAARGMIATLDYDRGAAQATTTMALDPEAFLLLSAAHDVAVCAVASGCRRRPVRCCRTVGVGEALCCVQHPNGAPKTLGCGTLLGAHNGTLYHNCDTLPGSSGAPLFDVGWTLVGIHRGATGGPAGGVNFAVSIPTVVRLLARRGLALV